MPCPPPRFASASRVTGNLTTTSVPFVAVSTLLDLTVAGAPGDVVEVSVSLAAASGAASGLVGFDVATMVDGAAVHFVSGGMLDGVPGWRSSAAFVGELVPRAGSVFYTLQPGDVTAGAVTFRLFWKSHPSGTVTATLYADGTNRSARVSVLNHGFLTAS